MTKPPPQIITAFLIVLSEEQLEDLGKFTAIFSQIDHMMFQIVGLASKTRGKNLLALIEGTTAGQRLAMLRRLADQMIDPDLRKKAKDVCGGLAALNEKRNHILHGVWGLEWDTKKDKLHPACAYERNSENPIYATQLPELCERAAKVSLKVLELLSILGTPLNGSPPHRFLIRAGPPPDRPAPDWQPLPSRRSAPLNPDSDQAK
jgi:hypothetical protein